MRFVFIHAQSNGFMKNVTIGNNTSHRTFGIGAQINMIRMVTGGFKQKYPKIIEFNLTCG